MSWPTPNASVLNSPPYYSCANLLVSICTGLLTLFTIYSVSLSSLCVHALTGACWPLLLLLKLRTTELSAFLPHTTYFEISFHFHLPSTFEEITYSLTFKYTPFSLREF